MMILDAARSYTFDFLMVMPGVVIALALGRLLAGGAYLLRSPRKRIYPLHLVWAAILFVELIQFWHAMSTRGGNSRLDEMSLYFLFLAFPTCLYLASAVLVPKDVRDTVFNFKNHYYEHAPPFFYIYGVAILFIIAADRFLISLPVVHEINGYRFAIAAAALLLAAVGQRWNDPVREQLHRILTILVLVLLVVFTLRFG